MSNGTAGIFAQRLPAIPEKHIYHVYIYRPISKDADSSAKIEIKYDGWTAFKYLDDIVGEPGRALLGNYKFTAGKTKYIRNCLNVRDKKILADVITITPAGEKAPTLQ